MADHSSTHRDILGRRGLVVLLYWVPIAAIMVSGNAPLVLRTAVWSTACLVMGAACLANAMRCGRVHCYFTGPFFLTMTAIVLTCGLGLISFGPHTWNYLGLALLVGGVGLTFGPELLLGRYRGLC